MVLVAAWKLILNQTFPNHWANWLGVWGICSCAPHSAQQVGSPLAAVFTSLASVLLCLTCVHPACNLGFLPRGWHYSVLLEPAVQAEPGQSGRGTNFCYGISSYKVCFANLLYACEQAGDGSNIQKCIALFLPCPTPTPDKLQLNLSLPSN